MPAPGGPSAADADPLPDARTRSGAAASTASTSPRSRSISPSAGRAARAARRSRPTNRSTSASTGATSSRFNEEGGFVEKSYQSGVPYEVLGAAPGSSLDSFIKNEGTGNGSLISPLDHQHDGRLRGQPARGTDAAGHSRHGSRRALRLSPAAARTRRRCCRRSVSRQTDGINHSPDRARRDLLPSGLRLQGTATLNLSAMASAHQSGSGTRAST